MKHQRQFGTEGGIASRAAVKQIRMMIMALLAQQNSDAYITAGEEASARAISAIRTIRFSRGC